MYVIRDKIKYRAKVRTKSQSGNTGFTDGLQLFNNAHVGYSLEEGWDKVDSFSKFIPHNTYSVQSKIGRIEFEINGIDDTSLNITYTPNYRFE